MPEHESQPSLVCSYRLEADVEKRLAERDHDARYQVVRCGVTAQILTFTLYLRFAAHNLRKRASRLGHYYADLLFSLLRVRKYSHTSAIHRN